MNVPRCLTRASHHRYRLVSFGASGTDDGRPRVHRPTGRLEPWREMVAADTAGLSAVSRTVIDIIGLTHGMVRGVAAVEDRLYVTNYFDGSVSVIDV